EVARVEGGDAAAELTVVECRIDDVLGKQRLVVAEADNEEALVRKLLRQPRAEFRVIFGAHGLAAQILVDLGAIAGIAPLRQPLGREAIAPRKMVGHGVDEEEQRPILALACDEARGGVEIEAVRLHLAGAEVARVEEAVDADRGLEGARAEEG